MKRLTTDLGILTPFLAALCILAGSVLLHVQEMRRLEVALAEQARLQDVRAALQAARAALLEVPEPDWPAAAPALRALADMHATEPAARARLERLLRERDAPSPVLDGLLAATAGAEVRHQDRLAGIRDTLWQRMWLMTGLGGLGMAYAGGMLLRVLRSRTRLEERLRFETTHDSLTALPNRRFLLQWTERALAQARRERQQLALVYVDLDGFRRVNDEQGREIGDRLLRVAARRFRERVREADMLARVGSDEYGVLTPVGDEPATVAPLARRLLEALGSPLLPQFGERYPVGASIGIAVFPRDGTRADELLQAAEAAMRVAKAEGGNCFRFAGAARGGPALT